MPKEKKPAMSSQELKRIREIMGVTQVELSQILNLAPQTIATWEGIFPERVNSQRRLFILLSARAYLDGDLSKHGELSEKFVNGIMEGISES